MEQNKRWLWILIGIVAVAALLSVANVLNTDTPPKFALNGTELNLAKLRVSDLNEAGFYLSNNDGNMPGSSFKEMLSYYRGNDRALSMGGVSVLNNVSSSRPYVDCKVFEISANSRNTTATYEGQKFFGKTKEELIEIFGEPTEESVSYMLVYRSKKKQYKTTFYFDTTTKQCYSVEIDRRESNLAR